LLPVGDDVGIPTNRLWGIVSILVRLLGPVDVTVSGHGRPLAGLRRKAVLARLALRPGEVVSTSQLIEAVWDGDPPAAALNSLQSHISYLRRVLGTTTAIRAQAPGYVLVEVHTDLRRAEELIERGRAASVPAQRLALFEQALRLWRGEPLADVAQLSWFAQEARRLDRVRTAARHAVVDCRLTLGQHAALIPDLTRLAELDPFDEDRHSQLMIALYRGGRQAEALAVFARLRDRLADEHGIDPSGSVRELHAAMLRQDPGLDAIPLPARQATPSPAAAGPLIERTAETELVDQVLEDTLDTRTGRVLIFEGPAGIGKTSLLDQARRRASVLGFTVVSARGTDLETEYGWGCARQLLGRYAETGCFPSPLPPMGQPPGGEYQTITSLCQLVSDAAARNPIVLVVDDVQWADPPSVRLLAFLAARLDAQPVVLVLGLRPGQQRVSRFTAAIASLPHTTTSVLRPLSVQGCGDLLAYLTAAEPGSDLAARCEQLTRGNPFLLKELAQRLSLLDGDLTAVLSDDSPNVDRFVARELSYLPAASAEAARGLAVLGGGAGSGWLAQLADSSPQAVLEALAPLVASGLVVADGIPVRFAFGHPLVRASIYESIPAARRAELHLRAARTATASHDPIKAATHLLRVPGGFVAANPVPDVRDADDPADGVPRLPADDLVSVLVEAADLSQARGSVDSAVAFLRRAVEVDLGDRRTEMLVRLGNAEAHVDCAAASTHLSEALARERDPRLRAQIAGALATTLWLDRQPREAAGVCLASLEHDRGMTDDCRQFLQGCLAMVAYGARQGTDLIELIDGYRDEPTDTSVGGLVLEGGMALHAMYRNCREEAERRALRVIAGDRLVGQPTAAVPMTSAWYALLPCDAPELLPAVETALDYSRRSGSLVSLAPSLYYRSEIRYARGQLPDALRDARDAEEAGGYAAISIGETFAANVRLRAMLAVGETDQAREVLRQMKARDAPGVTPTLYASGEIAVCLATGQTRLALAAAIATRDECAARSVVNPLACDWRGPMVRCLRLLGQHEQARAVADELLAASTEWGTPRAVGRALRYAALVESGPRELDLLEESVRLLEPTLANLERAQSRYAFGRALLRSGRPVDALSQLGTAAELAAFCGARPLRDAATAAARGAGRLPRPSMDAATRAAEQLHTR